MIFNRKPKSARLREKYESMGVPLVVYYILVRDERGRFKTVSKLSNRKMAELQSALTRVPITVVLTPAGKAVKAEVKKEAWRAYRNVQQRRSASRTFFNGMHVLFFVTVVLAAVYPSILYFQLGFIVFGLFTVVRLMLST